MMACKTRILTIGAIQIEEHPLAKSNFYLWLNPSESLSDVGIAEDETKRQGQRGIETGLASEAGREVDVQVEIVADDHDTLFTMEKALKAAVALPAAPDYADNDGYTLVELLDEDGIEKQFYARLFARTPSVDMLIDPAQRRRRIGFVMRAEDPTILAQTLQTEEGPESYQTTSFKIQDDGPTQFQDEDLPTFQDDTGGSMTVTNNGTTGVAPVLIVHGPADNPLIQNLTTGKNLDFSRSGGVSLAQDEFLTINVLDGTAVKTDSDDVETNEISHKTLDSEWIFIEPGANELTLFDDSPNVLDSQLEVQFRDAWI